MKTINLTKDDSDAIQHFQLSGQKAYSVFKKVFEHYKNDLGSVLNIDKKGNMGLQALARQEALVILNEIADIIFPDEEVAKKRAAIDEDQKKPFIPPYR